MTKKQIGFWRFWHASNFVFKITKKVLDRVKKILSFNSCKIFRILSWLKSEEKN